MAKERLSKLQKWILIEAFKNKSITRKQIYRDYFGIIRPFRSARWRRYLKGEEKEMVFNMWSKGHGVEPILCHSLRRLREKDLITENKKLTFQGLIFLTNKGEEVALKLSPFTPLKPLNNKEGGGILGRIV